MKDYEALIVVRALLTDEKVDALLTRFEKKIADNGGELEKTEKMGQRRLPFRLNKHKNDKEGLYVLIKFKGEGSLVNILKEDFRIQEDVIRHMVTRVPEPVEVVVEEPVVPAAQEGISGQPQ